MKCRIVVKAVSVDTSKCTGCGLCIEFCPTKVLAPGPNRVPRLVEPRNCIACIGCMAVCDPSALSLVTAWVCEGEQLEDTSGRRHDSNA